MRKKNLKEMNAEQTNDKNVSCNASKKVGTVRVIKRIAIAFLSVVLSVLLSLTLILTALFNGPSRTARNMAVKSFDETSAMKWLSSLFLSKETIDSILNKGKESPTEAHPTSEEPFIFDFGGEKEKFISVTLDIGYSMTLQLSSDLTVETCTLSDQIKGFSGDTATGKSFRDVSCDFLMTLMKNGEIEENVNDSLLMGSVSASEKENDMLNSQLQNVISENEIPITVLSLYSLNEDVGIAETAKQLGMSYNKVVLCKLVSDNAVGGSANDFYSLSFMNLTGLLDYCDDKNIDISSLVDDANIKEKNKKPIETEIPDDEWSDCPDGIKIIKITGKTYNATMLLIKDPSKVFAATSIGYRGINTFDYKVAGVPVLTAAKHEGAIAAINGGFFYDGNYHYQGKELYNGSMPFGSVVSKGEFIYQDSGGPYKGFIGFTNDNALVAFNRSITKEDYEKYGIRDGMSCAPVLIINGEPQSYAGAEDEKSLNPRTAIGQRADGAVMFLTIDGRMGNSLGGSYSDVIDIMLEYGAVTAGNLDGGTSSVMYYLDSRGLYGNPGEYVVMNNRSQISSPRSVPTYFMVKP